MGFAVHDDSITTRGHHVSLVKTLGFGAKADFVVPISAREGENLVKRAATMPWYEGPTLIEALDSFRPAPRPVELPLRLPVQDIYKLDHRRTN